MKQLVVGERMPGRLNEYIEQALPHYEAIAKSQRGLGGIQFQARYETDKIIVYSSPQTNFDDAIAMLEITLDSLLTQPEYSGMLPTRKTETV